MVQSLYHRTVDLLSADVGDELVALDAHAGHCYGFNTVAASVWRQLESPRSFDDLKRALLDEFDVSDELCTADLEELLADLVDKGLVSRTSGQDAR